MHLGTGVERKPVNCNVIPGSENGCADYLSTSSHSVEASSDDGSDEDKENYIVAAVDLPQMGTFSLRE
ncbi:hypothetical protein NDU88_007803 [Pleurodeles waltl]|uniref:Uncharacterized protein n=1 Tax=Pleurodeles waltl TaxID=8319 RepID=A0AAV7NU41_PLEWA|nr:hypothetical protein NDU88_007803 [Pleurodeles waltl]